MAQRGKALPPSLVSSPDLPPQTISVSEHFPKALTPKEAFVKNQAFIWLAEWGPRREGRPCWSPLRMDRKNGWSQGPRAAAAPQFPSEISLGGAGSCTCVLPFLALCVCV